MKTVIFAGGHETCLSEETHLKLKLMIEIGGIPILWHIMKNYARHPMKLIKNISTMYCGASLYNTKYQNNIGTLKVKCNQKIMSENGVHFEDAVALLESDQS